MLDQLCQPWFVFLEDNLGRDEIIIIIIIICKSRFWILSPQDNRIMVQRAQYKEFLESGLKTRFQWVGQRS